MMPLCCSFVNLTKTKTYVNLCTVLALFPLTFLVPFTWNMPTEQPLDTFSRQLLKTSL